MSGRERNEDDDDDDAEPSWFMAMFGMGKNKNKDGKSIDSISLVLPALSIALPAILLYSVPFHSIVCCSIPFSPSNTSYGTLYSSIFLISPALSHLFTSVLYLPPPPILTLLCSPTIISYLRR